MKTGARQTARRAAGEGGVPVTDEVLLAAFAALTEEEREILGGKPLDMGRYQSDSASVVEGRKFLRQNRLITIRPHTRFVAFPPHRHDYVELMYMLTGQTVHEMESGETITLRAGEMIFINRTASHAIRACGQADVAVNFIVQPAFFDFALELVGADNALGRFLLDALRSGEASVPYLYFPVADIAGIQCLLRSILYGFVEEKNMRRQIPRIEMGLLFLHLLANSDRMRMSIAVRRWNHLAVDLLNDVFLHYRDFDLAAFAAARGVSVSYISRVCREATGQTCTLLLQQRRMEKARQLLTQTPMSIANVCAAVGYQNSSYFFRLFRQTYCISPKELRSSHRT
jgi:AraC-like DNA-binding protein/quercetin dioxygenase-like cupin family protein